MRVYVRLLLTSYRIFFCLSSSFFLEKGKGKRNEGRLLRSLERNELKKIVEANILMKLFERLLRCWEMYERNDTRVSLKKKYIYKRFHSLLNIFIPKTKFCFSQWNWQLIFIVLKNFSNLLFRKEILNFVWNDREMVQIMVRWISYSTILYFAILYHQMEARSAILLFGIACKPTRAINRASWQVKWLIEAPARNWFWRWAKVTDHTRGTERLPIPSTR